MRPYRIAAPLGAVAIIIILHAFGWLAPVERWLFRFTESVTAPAVARSESIAEWLRNLNKDVRAENEIFRARIAALEEERAALLARADEAEALRTAIKFREAAPIGAVVARVVGSEAGGAGRELVMIDRGTRDGIEAGDPVVTTHGFLFGTVAEARDFRSSVLVLFDASTKIAASVVEHPATIGVAEGGFGLVVRFGLVPLESDLEVGNTIQTSTGGARIPAGIFIGRVEQIREDAHTPFKSAVISTFEPLGSTANLIVLHP